MPVFYLGISYSFHMLYPEGSATAKTDTHRLLLQSPYDSSHAWRVEAAFVDHIVHSQNLSYQHKLVKSAPVSFKSNYDLSCQ